jgi:hypothetical protein
MLFGAEDEVVYMERYDCDPPIVVVESRDHRSICKPDSDYLMPLEFVHGRSQNASTR